MTPPEDRTATEALTQLAPEPPFPYSSDQRAGLNQLQRAVYLFTGAQRRLAWRAKQNETVSPDRLRALVLLMAEGEMTHGQLVRETELNRASVSVMVDQLEAEGVVQRRPDERDGRVLWISLTDRGRATVRALQDQWTQAFTDAFADISEEQLADACDVLDRMTAVFDSCNRQ